MITTKDITVVIALFFLISTFLITHIALGLIFGKALIAAGAVYSTLDTGLVICFGE